MANIIAELKQLEETQLLENYDVIIKQIVTDFENFLTKSLDFLKKTNQRYLYFNISQWFDEDNNDERLVQYLVNFLSTKYNVRIKVMNDCLSFEPQYHWYKSGGDWDYYAMPNEQFGKPPTIFDNDYNVKRRFQLYNAQPLDENLYLINAIVDYHKYQKDLAEYRQHQETVKKMEDDKSKMSFWSRMFAPTPPTFTKEIDVDKIKSKNSHILEITW